MGTYSLGPMPLGVTEGVTGGGGPSAPATPVIYSNLAGYLATPTRFQDLVEMDSAASPFWTAIGVSDVITGTGQYGIGQNFGGNSGFQIPPDPQFTTFGLSMQNTPNLVLYEVDAADYMNNYNFGYPPGYEDFVNFGAYAEDPGAGGPSAATSWSWDVTILTQSFSGGAVAFTAGTGATTQQADFANNPGEGVLERVQWFLGRGGTILGGDSLLLEVAVTASNASGSAGAAVNVAINWV